MKKNILAIGLMLITLASCQQAKNKVMELASQEANKQCPMVIDEVTKLDSTTYNADENIFSYYYTLTGAADDSSAIESMKSEMEKAIPETIKQTEEMKIFREMDVTMDYIYLSGTTKQELFKVQVTPDQYK